MLMTRRTSSKISVPIRDTSIEPPHPSRLEKKNT